MAEMTTEWELPSLPLSDIEYPPLAETRQRARFAYDGPSDTLFIHFFGRSLPAVSVAFEEGDRDYLYVRVDPERRLAVGLQIEDFTTYAVRLHPWMYAALVVAEIGSMPPQQAAILRSIAERETRGQASPAAVLRHVEELLAA
jgi:hypothetical protein